MCATLRVVSQSWILLVELSDPMSKVGPVRLAMEYSNQFINDPIA